MALGGWFGKGRLVRLARERELAHEPEAAIGLYLRAERPEEAARVKLTLAEANRDPNRKLLELAQAIELSPPGSAIHKKARAERARYVTALHADGVTGAARLELERAAAELIELDLGREAAKTYRLLGDRAGEARALESAGAVEELELLFAEDDRRRRSQNERERLLAEIGTLQECGSRREALLRLASLLHDAPADARLAELAAQLRSRRVSGHAIDLKLPTPTRLIFGHEVVLGRHDAELSIGHVAVSRRHLLFRRDAAGNPIVRDLGSRNGTQRGGLPLAGELPVTESLSLTLGRTLPLSLVTVQLGAGPAALQVDIAGTHAILVLGERLQLEHGWSLAVQDDWLELQTPANAPAYLGGLQLGSPTTLLTGDRISRSRDGAVVLAV